MIKTGNTPRNTSTERLCTIHDSRMKTTRVFNRCRTTLRVFDALRRPARNVYFRKTGIQTKPEDIFVKQFAKNDDESTKQKRICT